ncbi:bifunctional 2-polyprenyl-6-hydroxyphenol methylase/3-demethylubiquinol 3-O-methyltransferase UbiG [Kordiimonas sp. SCSIO 12610]|uniref:class I SAM-dependent methyltransferase n=1 Tax=Kordiimonas sp. SCSIO 12610 TaxID=2829597 RepID=UPI002108EF8B|nr:class I SAM-dependent methyltransferase [Kordiimonas sp. SCSIO 12610]UTW55074.1 class I SAM-dependent methyltransferase [Kordiimonas sp. SCSIO 12610]
MSDDTWLSINKARWEERVSIHTKSSLYDVEGFLSGRLSLGDQEIHDMGSVKGKSLLHLQCHFGLDTLSWARLGANVTGLDFSEEAIKQAKKLAEQAELEAEFICADVYKAPQIIQNQFDIIYTGIGAICWLPDINNWAKTIAQLLKADGKLFLIEIHPVEWIFGNGFDLAYDYFHGPEGLHLIESGTYTDGDQATINNDLVNWNHNLGKVITALVNAGLMIKRLDESDECPFMRWDFMEKAGNSRYKLPAEYKSIPLMYTLEAIKP